MTRLLRRFRLFNSNDLFELCICIFIAGMFVLISSGTAFGQGNVGINNPTPHTKALLDMTSSDKGLLAPRMTAAQRTAIFPAPDATGKGMLVFQTDATQGFYYYDGSAWLMLQAGGQGWGLTGNTGTNVATNFIGTTDAQPTAFRTNNVERMRLDASGKLGIGTTAPLRQFEVSNAGQAVTRFHSNSAANGSVLELMNSTAGNNMLGALNFNDAISTPGQVAYHATNGLTLRSGWTERMRLDVNGNVGIGTTAPASRLQVSANSAGYAPNAASVLTVENSGAAYSSILSGTGETGVLFGASADPQNGGIIYNPTWLPNGMSLRTGGNATQMSINSAGDVTVANGASWTGMKLGVIHSSTSAGLGVRNTNPAGWSGLVSFNSTSTGGSVLGFGNSGHALANLGFTGTTTAHPFVVLTSNVERVRVDAFGSVGIGTTTPGRKLDVVDDATGLVARFQGTNATAYSMLHILRSDNVGAHIGFFNPGIALPLAGNFVLGTFGNAPVSLTTNNVERVRVDVSGNVGIGTTAPTAALEVNGFTKLGSNAPAIKQLEFAATTAATEGGSVDIAHGLTVGKIMSVQVLIEYSAGNWISSGYTINAEYQADYVVGAVNIRLYNQGTNSGNILSKPVKVLVTYKA